MDKLETVIHYSFNTSREHLPASLLSLPSTVGESIRSIVRGAWAGSLLIVIFVAGGCGSPADRTEKTQSSTANPEQESTQGPAQTTGAIPLGSQASVHKVTLGIMAADIDTSLEQYLDRPGGISSQCQELNDLMSQVCCEEYSLGCYVEYECQIMQLDESRLMSQTSEHYRLAEGRPNYSMNHGSVVFDVERFMDAVQLTAQSEGVVPIPFTRHPIIYDDEETKDEANKINPRDLRAHWLGLIQPDRSSRGGTRVLLDYYSSPRATLLSVTPVNTAALAQAVTEFRSGVFSFRGKELTGTGARDLFDLTSQGRLVPSRSGCISLSRSRQSE